MKVTPTRLPEVLVIEPRVFGESRGWFMESWHATRYATSGIPPAFVQDNVSYSVPGVLRGLHYQLPNAQGKLVGVLEGEVYDVAVDIRLDSPTFRQSVGVVLSSDNHKQLWVPEGFAHGFLVLKAAIFFYKVTAPYDAKAERTVLWSDEELGIEWPERDPVLSDRDARAPRLRDVPRDQLPRVAPATEREP